MKFSLVVVSLFALVACKDATGKQHEAKPVEHTAPAAGSGSAVAPQVAQANAQLEELKKKDANKGDGEDGEWTPAEFKQGTARWKDVGGMLERAATQIDPERIAAVAIESYAALQRWLHPITCTSRQWQAAPARSSAS